MQYAYTSWANEATTLLSWCRYDDSLASELAPKKMEAGSMTPLEILNYVQAAPFRPFRIRMNSSRTFDIRHPEMVRVGARDIIIFKFVSDNPDVYDDWDSFSLVLIEAISHLEASVAWVGE